MQNVFNQLIVKVDKATVQFGPIRSLVNAIADRILPQAEAQGCNWAIGCFRTAPPCHLNPTRYTQFVYNGCTGQATYSCSCV